MNKSTQKLSEIEEVYVRYSQKNIVFFFEIKTQSNVHCTQGCSLHCICSYSHFYSSDKAVWNVWLGSACKVYNSKMEKIQHWCNSKYFFNTNPNGSEASKYLSNSPLQLSNYNLGLELDGGQSEVAKSPLSQGGGSISNCWHFLGGGSHRLTENTGGEGKI